jgi:hypothetical protein
MNWTEYDRDNPPPIGKYVVKTETTMGNVHRVEATLSFSGKSPSWSCTNQIVTHFLNEKEEDMDREEIIEMLQKKLRYQEDTMPSSEESDHKDGVRLGRILQLEDLIMELQNKTSGI